MPSESLHAWNPKSHPCFSNHFDFRALGRNQLKEHWLCSPHSHIACQCKGQNSREVLNATIYKNTTMWKQHIYSESQENHDAFGNPAQIKLCAFLDQCRVTQNALCNLAMTMSQIPGSETAPASPEYLKSGQHNKLKNRTKHDFQFPFKELTNQKQDSSANIKWILERYQHSRIIKINYRVYPEMPADEQILKSPKNWNV